MGDFLLEWKYEEIESEDKIVGIDNNWRFGYSWLVFVLLDYSSYLIDFQVFFSIIDSWIKRRKKTNT